MKLDILFLIFIGFFIKLTQSDGHGGKHVHVKILLPIPIHNHKHTHTIIKKPKEEKKIVIHKHHHHHGHDHGHKHGHKHKHDHGHNHKHGHHHGHKHNHDHHHHQQHKGGHFGHHYKVDEKHDDWNKHSNLENFDNKEIFKPSLPYEIDSYGLVPSFNEIDSGPNPENIDDNDDYYNSHKSLRSESFHITEAKNSQTNDPVGKHYISGNYKVHETDPIEQIHTRYGKIFQAPLANINVHESSYGPPPSGNGNESESVYNDSDEYDYGDEGEDQSENYNYDETIDKMQTNEAPKYNSLYGVEPLKQFFLNKIQ